MSPFLTVIPVDLKATTDLLPRNAYITGVTWNPKTQALELEWGHQELSHGYTFPVEFPIDRLLNKKLPDGVKRRGGNHPEPIVKKSSLPTKKRKQLTASDTEVENAP